MLKIILCRGIQGSSKTTWAKQNDIRNMLGKYWIPSREDLVKDLKSTFLWSSMHIDNMNLNPEGIVPAVVRPKYDLEFKDFFISLQDCIERDSKRPNLIGEKVIRKTYEKYKDILI